MTRVDIINKEIKDSKIETDLISDGYHTFGELYEHRCTLFIALCKHVYAVDYITQGRGLNVWRSKAHSDGSVWEDWFILGINKEAGKQITYHLPISMWDECDGIETLDKAPDYDGHSSSDVLKRLKEL